MNLIEIVSFLEENRNPSNLAGMARYGISTLNTYGISIPVLRKKAKEIGVDHRLAIDLFGTGVHEAKILAALIDDPSQVNLRQMEEWVKQFDSWDVTDQVSTILFDKTVHAWKIAIKLTKRKGEYEKRAAYSIMAGLAVHDVGSPDSKFRTLFPHIIYGAMDERNYVRKAVSWALRNIGKRNTRLNKAAIQIAEKLKKSEYKSARWIGADAFRELTSLAVKEKVELANQRGIKPG
jgi:3-methyladenine DNA glycosylase AlkD